jgi:hypothetical protein
MWWITLLACESVETPVLADVQSQVFDSTCTSSSCHGHGATEGGLSLAKDDTYDALVTVTGSTGDVLVVPGDADASYLIWKLEGRPEITGEPMPKDAPAIDEERIALVRSWIDSGAWGGARRE